MKKLNKISLNLIAVLLFTVLAAQAAVPTNSVKSKRALPPVCSDKGKALPAAYTRACGHLLACADGYYNRVENATQHCLNHKK